MRPEKTRTGSAGRWFLSAHCANMCYDIRAESPACRNHERTKKSKMKLNRVKQISIVMAAADVVDNGLSVSRNNVPKAQADVKEWTDLLSLGN